MAMRKISIIVIRIEGRMMCICCAVSTKLDLFSILVAARSWLWKLESRFNATTVDSNFSRVIETIGKQSCGESLDGGRWLQSSRKFCKLSLSLLSKRVRTLKYSFLQRSCCSFLQSKRHICFGWLVWRSQSGNANRHRDGMANVEQRFERLFLFETRSGMICFSRSSIWSCCWLEVE